MRAGIYLRQSQYHDGSISMDDQERICRLMCEREGWEVAGVWRDDDTPGGSADRAGLVGLRAAYAAGQVDIAVAREISRFARNMKDGADIVGDMRLASVMEGVQPEDDDFIPLLHFLLAHKQRTEIGKRWKQVHAYKVAKGLPATGRARFGYRYEGKVYTPDPVTAPVLVEVYRRYTAGEGWHVLAADLNRRGLVTTTGSVWRMTTLRKVCDSGFAAGLITVHGELLPGAHEALLSAREWRLYQAARASRAQLAPRSQTPAWFLSGIAVCGSCGTGLVSTGRREHPSVSCPTRRLSGTCEGVHVSRPGLEAVFGLWLGGHTEEWAAALPDHSAERAAAEAALEAAEARLEALRLTSGRLARLLADEVLDEDGYRLARAELEAEARSAAAEVQEAALAVSGFLPADADVYERLVSGSEGVGTGEWHGLLRRVVRRVEVHKDRLVVVPVRGEAVTLARPARAKQARGEGGRFA